MRTWVAGVVRIALVVAGVHASVATSMAQPWVPPPGEGSVSLTYQNYYVTGHFSLTGDQNKNGATHSKALLSEFDVGLPQSFGLTVSLPFIASKYTGPDIYYVGGYPTTPGPLDDGVYHGAVQDLHVEGRRMFDLGRIAVAPLAGITIPTHEYETRGEAVPGRHRTDVQFGASAGVDLGTWVPSTYVHAHYALAAAERIDGIPSVRSNIGLEGGYDLTRRWTLKGVVDWQIKHQGPTLAELFAHGWDTHDRFIVSSYTNLGGGISIRLRSSLELSGTWIAAVKGSSGAHVSRLLAVGLTREFGGGLKGLGGSATGPK